jgi:uncharacterized protein YndB with AHSA1/START domain
MENTSLLNSKNVSSLRVGCEVHAKAEHLKTDLCTCWDLITRPEQVGMWFGDLSDDLATSATARLDFGDGDFFTIHGVQAHAPNSLAYSWRFLDMGATSEISWQISGRDGDLTVELKDRSPQRSEAAAEELREGWLDFLQRLDAFVATGNVTRYDFRREFDGAIELNISTDELAKMVATAGGLFDLIVPVLRAANESGEIPSISAVHEDTDLAIRFDLAEVAWEQPTLCSIYCKEKGQGSAIVVRQTGWDKISSDQGLCISRRRFYSARWRDALSIAKHKLSSLHAAALN